MLLLLSLPSLLLFVIFTFHLCRVWIISPFTLGCFCATFLSQPKGLLALSPEGAPFMPRWVRVAQGADPDMCCVVCVVVVITDICVTLSCAGLYLGLSHWLVCVSDSSV